MHRSRSGAARVPTSRSLLRGCYVTVYSNTTVVARLLLYNAMVVARLLLDNAMVVARLLLCNTIVVAKVVA